MQCMESHLTLPEPTAPATKLATHRDHSDEESEGGDFSESSETSSVSNPYEDETEVGTKSNRRTKFIIKIY
jgi:hypothetical protein